MKDHRVYLRVKIKSLAAEARIIRAEELKCRKKQWKLRNGLSLHRRGIVRSVSRDNSLAYGFLRGRPYSKLETKGTKALPNFNEIWKLAKRFGVQWDHGNETREVYLERLSEQEKRFEAWKTEALAFLEK